jgi:SAM-dependent methyltransferase
MAGGEAATVLDVAAGTGKLTTQLRDLGHSVVALELSEQMLRQLRSHDVAIPAAAGRAEALPFRAASFDVITVAQAWHWFEQPVAAAEFARVLRPGGHSCILWNFRDEAVDWVAELSTIIGSEGTSETESDGDPLAGSSAFTPSIKRTYRFEQPLDQGLLVSLVRSRSYVASLPVDEQRVVLNRIVELCQEHPQLSGRPRFSMPYRSLVFRAERL